MTKEAKDGADAVAKTEKSTDYLVHDTNQRGPNPRKHDVIVKMYKDGQEPDVVTYDLFSGGPGTPMPMEHAMRFLIDPAFRVTGPTGNRLMPVAKFDPSRPITQLADDEIVVRYEELSKESLFRRVKILPGSEVIAANSKPEEMIQFLRSYRERQKGMTEAERTLAAQMQSGSLGGAMTGAMLDKMFGEQRQAA